MNRPADLADRALDFRVAGMADQDQSAAARDVPLALDVHLGNQRAGRVEHRQAARLGLIDDRLCDAMGTENRHRAVRDFVQLLDEHRALALERLDHMTVVDDLVTHVDRRAELLERPIDDVDCPHDAGAKAARLSQKYPHPDISFRWQGLS